tara:strand:- start:10942 stop:12033 length:1092 start_codon:yes stop_codon:yes gene_type:complete
MINNLYLFKDKTVIITGHTGFKGSWLTLWLTYLGAKVIGVSSNIPTKPSNYVVNRLQKKIKHIKADVRDEKKITKIIKLYKPDYIFHLAAQSLVKKSYLKSRYTFMTNTIGTLNILEALKNYNPLKVCSVVIITSDKSYKNVELKRGYKEDDILGGYDPYSASKASAELIIQSYFKTFLVKKKNIKISVARAGNVIGGGDWSEDRIIPDCMRSIFKKKRLILRFPKSTRPWQHVLEALYGYMLLALKQKKNQKINGNVFNFGPNNQSSIRVIDLIRKIKKRWNLLKWKIFVPSKAVYESKLLKLNSNKAFKLLNWKCHLNTDQTLSMVVDWYKFYFESKKTNMYNFSIKQIEQYQELIKNLKK